MCTAATYKTTDFYFGRNLDFERSWGESVTITPRKYQIALRSGEVIRDHFAMIGMAHVRNGYPLYYDAVNEKGLCIAGLNFVSSTVYGERTDGKECVAQFEFIPWLLSKCADVGESRALISRVVLTGERFEPELPSAKLHWLIADRNDCIVVESTKDGLHIYDNQFGVLTNEPEFPVQAAMMNSYANLTPKPAVNRSGMPLTLNSRGMGGIGLPGDLTSMSRFARAAFVRANSKSAYTEEASVSQFFHILGSVEQQKGLCELDGGDCEYTIYTSCVNADKGIYYYRTYDGLCTYAVDMRREKLDGTGLVTFPIESGSRVERLN